MVYVLGYDNTPLTPIDDCMANCLLTDKRAVLKSFSPPVIKLQYKTRTNLTLKKNDPLQNDYAQILANL